MIIDLWLPLAAGLLSFGLGFPAKRLLARIKAVDHPNARSSHEAPTVRGGGAAILAVVLGIGVWLALGPAGGRLAWLLMAALGVAVISFLDDLTPLPAAVRLSCHALAAGVVLHCLNGPWVSLTLSPGQGLGVPRAAGVALVFVWIVGYTNAFNFMDGINGLAAGQAVITATGMALVAGIATGHWSSPPVLLALALAGAAAGFVPHNFPKARMFMGDVGSAPIGFLLAALVIWMSVDFGSWLFLPLTLLHANFILDTAITFFRRVGRGEKWHQAHREHFYQRLVRSGKSHVFTTGWKMTLQGVTLAASLASLHASHPVRIALAGGVILLWLGFFGYCEACFRRRPDLAQ